MATTHVILAALVSTALIAVVVFVSASGLPAGRASLIEPGAAGPATEIIRADFPDAQIEPDVGHDGQQFYAIARAPMHLDEVSESLGRPRYRLQRPLFSWVAWSLHPFGGGPGLVLSMFAVGVAGIFLLAVAATFLSLRLGGGPWPAVVVPLLPGVFTSLRIGVADNLALGLALLSVYLSLRGRTPWAVVTAVLAVLTKEAMLVLLLGQAVARRGRAEVVAAGSAAAVAAGWWLALRALVEADSEQVVEFTLPFKGFLDGLTTFWLDGSHVVAGLHAVVVLGVAAWTLWRASPTHPLFGGVCGLAALSVVLNIDVVGLDFNGPRTLMPLLVVALLTLTTPDGGRDEPVGEESEDLEHA